MLLKSQIQNSKNNRFRSLGIWLFSIVCNLVFGIWNFHYAYAQPGRDAIIINGDTVEYSMDNKEVSASGNIVINYKGSTLTCDKISVNTQTKEAVAEGNVHLEDSKGIITGSKMNYNFNDKTGLIQDAGFRSLPYFGQAEKLDKINEQEFIAYSGSMTTCNYDHPHYRIESKKIDYFLREKVTARGNIFSICGVPILYLPKYTHNFAREKLMNIEISPGSRKGWGPYMLTMWRYNINDKIEARFYLDYRWQLGAAEGIGLNYNTGPFGHGDYKFYYTKEIPKDKEGEKIGGRFERYLARWRHKWDIDKRTSMTAEYYKINDQKRKLNPDQLLSFTDESNDFLKYYFFREYELASQPLSYIFLHHNFNYSSIDLLFQRRTNHWYAQLDKAPELKYSLPNIRIAGTPIYFENNASLGNFFKNATTSPASSVNQSVSRFDMTNKFSLPLKVVFLQLTPFVANRETIYDKGADGRSIPKRTIFYSGADLSTKFYRIFNVKSNLLGLDINGLRHIITPTVAYDFNPKPTISSDKLKQIDEIDSITRNESIGLELSNKLQTKRNGQSVDLVNVRASTNYILRPSGGGGSRFTDFLFDIELIPYSWMRLRSNAIYGYKEGYFKEANVGLSADLGKERSFGIGQRYARGGGKELTSQLIWRLNSKWKFRIYERYQFAKALGEGLKEQEYAISRDLHCWEMDVSYNISKDNGHTIWCVFRLKAFPELEFGFEQSYHPEEAGSQSNP